MGKPVGENSLAGGDNVVIQTAEMHNANIGVTTESIKSGIMQGSQTPFRTNQGSIERQMSAQVQGLVEDIAKGNYGLATEIAKQAISKQGWNQYGGKFSEKQAYILAKAAYENKLITTTRGGNIAFKDVSKQVRADEARKASVTRANREINAAKKQQVANIQAGNAKYTVGSAVTHSQFGAGKIIAMDDKIIEVDFGGTKRKMLRSFARFS